MIRLLLAVACLFAEQAYAESTDKVDASSHWAFQPILSPKLPPTRTKDWVKNEIDAFILHRLEKSGISHRRELPAKFSGVDCTTP